MNVSSAGKLTLQNKNYTFTPVAVYAGNGNKVNVDSNGQVDLTYNISVRTTTNLPITVEMYRNEIYGEDGITNMLGTAQLKQDVDGAWYRTYAPSGDFEMPLDEDITDIYTLVINFPKEYSEDVTYADNIENIEISINSQQVV